MLAQRSYCLRAVPCQIMLVSFCRNSVTFGLLATRLRRGRAHPEGPEAFSRLMVVRACRTYSVGMNWLSGGSVNFLKGS